MLGYKKLDTQKIKKAGYTPESGSTHQSPSPNIPAPPTSPTRHPAPPTNPTH